MNVDYPTWVIASLDREAERLGVTRQSVIKMWIAERLERKASWRRPADVVVGWRAAATPQARRVRPGHERLGDRIASGIRARAACRRQSDRTRMGASVEAACDTLLDSADANTVRSYLNDHLTVEDLPRLEHRLNQALGGDLPRKVRRARLDLVIDLHEQPV